MSTILEAALELASLGWKVVPLHELVAPGRCSCRKGSDCPNPGKHPRPAKWQLEATDDETQITQWWTAWPNANLGVKLGVDSGIIDIECDSPEAEKELAKLFGDDFPICPTYVSSRGKHRLFRWTSEIPVKDKVVFKLNGIEFRTGNGGGGAQSVFPPSTHPTGAAYRWKVHPSYCDPPELPQSVIDRIYEHFGFERDESSGRSREEWDRLLAGVREGERNDTAAAVCGKFLSIAGDIHDNAVVRIAWSMVQLWNTQNRPPIEEPELRSVFNSILQREQSRRTNEDFKDSFRKFVDTGDAGKPDSIGDPAGQWRLVIVESKPRVYKLYSPLWSTRAEGGFIELTSMQLKSAELIRSQAIEQADLWLERDFAKAWNGTKDQKGLAAQLLESADYEAAPTEEHRERWLASLILGELARAKPFEEDEKYTGKPQILDDGSVVFMFDRLYDKHRFGPDGVKRSELSKTIRLAGGKDFAVRTERGTRRLKIISQAGIQKLEHMVEDVARSENYRNSRNNVSPNGGLD